MQAFLDGIVGWFYRWRRKLATAAVGLLACFVAYHALFGANGMLVYQHKKAEFSRQQKELDSLQQENERLQQQIKSLKTDPAAIEKEAREQLRYTRPGEVIYLIPEQQKNATPPASSTAQVNPTQ